MSINLIQTVITAGTYKKDKWIHDALDQKSSMEDIERRAVDILQQFETKLDSRTDKTRYQFGPPSTARERLLKLIFNWSFKAQPDAIIAAAESLHPEQAAFYPQWKKVCWIQIPMLAAGVLNNILVKVILSVIVLYKSGKACHAAYAATPALIARSMPFIINHTPLVLVRAVNTVLNLKELAYGSIIIILFFSLAGQQIILRLLPEIPHVTPLARRLKIWSAISMLTNSPQTISDFVWDTACNAATFTWSNCTELANSIEGRARQANDERLAICKAKSFQVWQTIMVEQEPAR